MHAWFAPTGNLILLPYTFFSFPRAVYYWLVTNIFIIFFSAILLWHDARTHVWIPLCAFIGFSATLLSLYMGQVNTLVVLGLALFIFFDAKKRDFLAGACLVFVTTKPHLVILALPLITLNAIWHKRFKLLSGFASVLVACALILWRLYPNWLNSFWRLITSGMNGFREAPTIPGLLVHAGYGFGEWLWVAALMTGVIGWWKFKDKIKQRNLLDVAILAGMIVSPIGWSYDQIVLFVPLCHVLEWMANGALSKRYIFIITFTLIVTNLMSYYERTLSLSEAWFFWIPVITTIVYLFAWTRMQVTTKDIPKI